MPIQVESRIRVLTQNQFRELDHRVMPIVYAVPEEHKRRLGKIK